MRFDTLEVGTEFYSNYQKGGIPRKYKKAVSRASIWEGDVHREGGCAHQIPSSYFIRDVWDMHIFCFPNDLEVEVS